MKSAPPPPALFYPPKMQRVELVRLVAGIRTHTPEALDLVEFPSVTGGSASRELAIPYVPDMDEVVVDLAQLGVEGRAVEEEVPAPEVDAGTDLDVGVVVALERPERLATIELELPVFEATSERYVYDKSIQTRPDGEAKQMRIVVRPAERSGTSFTFGPPIFAHPALPSLGALYGPILSGLTVSVTSERVKIGFGGVQGAGWLIQFVHGDDPANLKPLAFTAKVAKVAIQAAPRDVAIVIPAAEGGEEIELWSHPNALLPSAGPQEIDFSPIAQRRLAAQLAKPAGSTDNVTLPIPLEFSSKSGGQLVIRSKVLTATYRVRPVAPDAAALQLRGAAATLTLEAPAGRKPESGVLTLLATHLGRERNLGSSPLALEAPVAGIRVAPERWAAAPAVFHGGGELLSAGVYVSARENTEAVLELRADVAGVPGAPLCPAVVRQLDPGTLGWVEFELPAALTLAAPQPLWLALRSTRGELLWFGQGAGSGRVSLDGGRSWGDVDPALAAPTAPLLQLFHAVPKPKSAHLDVLLGAAPLEQITLAPEGQREFAARAHSLPGAVLDALLALDGTGRRRLDLTLTSTAVLDLRVQDALLAYNPFAPGGR